MLLSFDERPELVAVSKSKDKMKALRGAISQKFEKVWLMVHCDNGREMYGIEVCNVWGNQLPKDQDKEIRSFVKKWMKEQSKS